MRFVLLGEQATGKSSLLVALYGALVNRRAGDLRLVRTVDEVEFLSRGLQAFGRQESLRRTEVDSHARLFVEVAHGDDMVGLDVPDRSGELLKHMLDARVWEPELRTQIGVADGAMLFLRADNLAPAQASEAGAKLFGHSADDAGPGRLDVDAAAWTPALMPADARAVDLLQALLGQRPEPLPLAIIISAWDSVSSAAPAPPAWLAEHAPLLDQFLASHSSRLPHAVFGVSAQGGDFSAGLANGLRQADPWERAYVVCPDQASRTLAEPILWLLGTTS
jgi:Double-GTPase 1